MIAITQRVAYAGIATRAVALALDVLLAHIIVLGGAAILSLIGSVVPDVRFDTLAKLLAAAAWAAVLLAYFVVFWSTTGQTPGMRALGIRVVDADDSRPPRLLQSLVRVVGLGLAIIPLFAGFLPVLVDDRRRALQDFLAGTVVVYA
jgi:uncharacterized RDD family membrane protein YckC